MVRNFGQKGFFQSMKDTGILQVSEKIRGIFLDQEKCHRGFLGMLKQVRISFE